MDRLVDFLKALAEETRVKIIRMLCREEMCVCEIIKRLDLSQPAVSHHLKILRQAGLINDRQVGKWTFYSLNKEGFNRSLLDLERQILEPVGQSDWQAKNEPFAYYGSGIEEDR